MEILFMTIVLAFAIPAYLIAGIREYTANKRNKRVSDAETAEKARLKEELVATPEEVETVDEMLRRGKLTEEEYQHKLLVDCGLANDFFAIYGSNWKKCAVFRTKNAIGAQEWGWDLKGFHNSPCGERIYLPHKELDAVKALLLSKIGKVPPETICLEPHVNIVPYSFSPWNIENGNAWYRRIEKNLRAAGKDVTMYFEKRGRSGVFDGAFFVGGLSREMRW